MGDNQEFGFDMSALRCLLEVPGILTSQLRSQASHFHLCSFCQDFGVLGVKRARDPIAESDSLTLSLVLLLLPPWLLQRARCEVGVNGLRRPFRLGTTPSFSVAITPPRAVLMTNLLEKFLSHGSY